MTIAPTIETEERVRGRVLLPLGLGAILAMMGVLAILGFEYFSALETGKAVVEDASVKTRLVYQMRDAIRKRTYSLARVQALDDFFARDEEQQQFFGYAREYLNARDTFLDTILSAEEVALYEELTQRLRIAEPTANLAMELAVEGAERESAARTISEAVAAQGAVMEILDWMVQHQEFIESKQKADANKRQEQVRLYFLLAALATLGISLLTAFYIVRREGVRTERMYREISHRKRAEEAARSLNQMLEGRVTERTLELESEIVARKAVDERLRASETQSRTIIDTAAIGIIVIDEKGTIESFNPAAEKIFAMKAQEVIGKNVSSLMPEPYKSEHDGYLEAYLSGRPARIIGIGREVEGKRSDGREFPLQLSVSEMSVNGTRKFVGMVDDITHQKLVEEEILFAKETAEVANQSKSDFLANMSHELRTPLNAIIGYSEAIGMEMFGALGHEKYKEYTVNIISSGRHLLDLVNDILDISAIEAGKMELYEEDFSPFELSEECLSHVRGWANREGNRLIADISADLPDLHGDRRRIKQVILNLLSNAIKFTPAGGTVRLTQGLAPDGRFCLSVADTGVGMKEEDVDKAFSPFQQIGRGTTSRHEGSGLGLPLSRNFALLHDGAITIESQVDKGTTATLWLPASRVLASKQEIRS